MDGLVVEGGDGACLSCEASMQGKVVELSWYGVCFSRPQLHEPYAVPTCTKDR